MRKRTVAWLTLAAAVVVSGAAQLTFGKMQTRIHQHREAAPAYNPETALNCIRETETSKYQYDENAVDVDQLSTHLPLVIIETDEEIPGVPYYDDDPSHRKMTLTSSGEEFLVANMKIINQDDKLNTPQDPPSLKTQIRIRVRGNTSRWFDKQSFAIKTIHHNGENKKVSMMGMEADHDWALHGPFLDKTLMRNYVAMNLVGELMDYAPDVRFCEVVINGEYRGVYVMMETVSTGKGRIEIEKPNKTRNVTGYIVELDNDTQPDPLSEAKNFTKYTQILRKNAFFDIRYPKNEALTLPLKDYIERDLSRFEKALYSFDYDTQRYGYKNFIDVDEFVDYFILMEVFVQHDTGNLSTFFYKDVNGKFKPVVWDFNNSLGNVSESSDDDYLIRQFVSVQAPWFTMLIKDEDFIHQVIYRYRQLRAGILSDERVSAYIQEVVDYLGPAVDRNFAVWGYSFDPGNLDKRNKLSPEEKNPRSYEAAVKQFHDAYLERLAWLDENIEVLKQYCHESAVKKYNH